MPITLKTGAMIPAIPPSWSATNLHDINIAPETKILPASGAITGVDFLELLNLMWQIKTFDLECTATLADPDFGDDFIFLPQKTQTITIQDVAIFEQVDINNDPSPLTNLETAPALARLKFVDTEYAEDRSVARQAIRNQFSVKLITSKASEYSFPHITRISDFQTYRAALNSDFEAFFTEWTTETQENFDAFENNTSDRGVFCAEEYARQLAEIPDLKQAYEIKRDQVLGQLDAAYAASNNDPNGAVARSAILENFKMQQLLKAEKNLQLFELAHGFERQVDFFRWHEISANASLCLPSFAGFSIDDNQAYSQGKNASFPSGIFFDGTNNQMAAYIEPRFGTSKGTYTFDYQVQAKNAGESPYTLTKTAEKVVQYLGLKNADGGPPAVGLSTERAVGYRQAIGSGNLEGGVFIDADKYTNTVGVTYADFFDQDGQPKSPLPDFSDFNALYPDEPEDINAIVYSGILVYGNWQPAIEFFQPVADKLKEINDAESVAVGVFKVLDEDDVEFFNGAIYANPYIFSEYNVTYKIKTRWTGPVIP